MANNIKNIIDWLGGWWKVKHFRKTLPCDTPGTRFPKKNKIIFFKASSGRYKTHTSLYLPDDVLIVHEIYISKKTFIVFYRETYTRCMSKKV